jgi:hypothetical protein
MMTVGRLPIQSVNIGPYVRDHFSNWIHGDDVGIRGLLPMKGSGRGPGGMRRERIQS